MARNKYVGTGLTNNDCEQDHLSDVMSYNTIVCDSVQVKSNYIFIFVFFFFSSRGRHTR